MLVLHGTAVNVMWKYLAVEKDRKSYTIIASPVPSFDEELLRY